MLQYDALKPEAPADRFTVSELLFDKSLNGEKPKVLQIFNILLDLIETAKLVPGQMISEKEISDALQASKTPVREALIRLEDAELVNIVPKSGTYVAPVRADRFVEACFLRLELEAGAVRAGAMRDQRAQDFEPLDQCLADQRIALDKDDYDAFFRLDEQFHEALFIFAGLPGIWKIIRRSQSEVYRVRHLRQMHNFRNGEKVLNDHHEIVDALRQKSPERAEAALIKHIGALERKVEALRTHPELFEYIDPVCAARPLGHARKPSLT